MSNGNNNNRVLDFSSVAGSSNVLMFFSLVLLLGLLIFLDRGNSKNKGKLARGRWAGASEKATAREKAVQLFIKPSLDKNALWIGTPPEFQKIFTGEDRDKLPKKAGNYRGATLYFPDVNRSIWVSGSAGSGKTFNVINSLLLSAIDQGKTISLYDFKYPEQASSILPYALERGYRVGVFAPGYSESLRINVFDFLKDETDFLGAGELAENLMAAVSAGSSDKKDPFFEPAGIGLLKGTFLVTKTIAKHYQRPDLADLMTASAIINLPDLSERLKAAKPKLNIWTYQAFAQLIGAHGSGKEGTNNTEAGIIATAQKVFQSLVIPQFIPALCGESNFPTFIDGKYLVVFGMNQDYRETLAPIVSAIMSKFISTNIAHGNGRKTAFVNCIDEFPSIILTKITKWLAEARSAGHIGILGIQDPSQAYSNYGKDKTQTIFSNCAIKFILNPQNEEMAKMVEAILGQKEVEITNKSTSYQQGKKSPSTSQQTQTVPLMPASEIGQMNQGEAIIIAPGFQGKVNGKIKSYLPLLWSFKPNSYEQKSLDRAKNNWQKIYDNVREKVNKNVDYTALFNERVKLVEEFLPLPKKNKTSSIKLVHLIALATKAGIVILPNSVDLEQEIEDLSSEQIKAGMSQVHITKLLDQYRVPYAI
jgi:type IV secretory pathway TraG/TraD family ATPase VirD4